MMAEPYYKDRNIVIYNRDCRDMRALPDGSVQMVCTSPPYWGLRKYSGEQELIWGGDGHCEHSFDMPTMATLGFNTLFRPGGETSTPLGLPSDKGKYAETVKGGADRQQRKQVGSSCSLCGAWKGAYGLEPTPEMYIEHTIEILRVIRRVLRKDGVVFWNIGDSYSSGGRKTNKPQTIAGGSEQDLPLEYSPSRDMLEHRIIKPKDLCLIPFRLAIACQEDGWWVRSIIIWSKPNPMPESVTDRPTESHEYLLMLTQSGASLYWTHRDGGGGTRQKPKADYRWVKQTGHDISRTGRGSNEPELSNRNFMPTSTGQIVEEVAVEPPDWKVKIPCPQCEATGIVSVYLGLDVWQDKKCDMCGGKKETQLWKRINLWKGHDYYWDADAVREVNADPERTNFVSGSRIHGLNLDRNDNDLGERSKGFVASGRNIRTVWEFPTQPYPEAHFAVFPEKLPEICIKAATPEVGCCSKCGAPWERIVERGLTSHNGETETQYKEDMSAGRLAMLRQAARERGGEYINEAKTIGWQPTCNCNDDRIPSLVLDPCGGTGTVAWVGKKLNRRCAIYEIAKEYCDLAVERNRQQVMELS